MVPLRKAACVLLLCAVSALTLAAQDETPPPVEIPNPTASPDPGGPVTYQQARRILLTQWLTIGVLLAGIAVVTLSLESKR